MLRTRPLPDLPPLTLIVEDVTLVDVVAGQLRPHADILIAGRWIVAVTDHRRTGLPSGIPVVNGVGRFLIPGLWDMHVHALWSPEIPGAFLPLFVAEGVAGVRDMGGDLALLAEARDSTRLGALFPRIVAAGPIIDGPDPVNPEISVAVGDSVRGRQVVDSLVANGADFIKVYTLLPRGALLAVLEEAKEKGLPVVGHVPAAVTPAEAARWGQRSMEHLRDELESFCTPRTVAACDSLIPVLRRFDVWRCRP